MKGDGTMHKKLKIEGHVAHVLHDDKGRDTGCLYTVNPEKGRVTAWIPLCVCDIPASYIQFKTINIIPRMLGRHGYLQGVINQLRDLVVAEDAVSSLVDSLFGDGSLLNGTLHLDAYVIKTAGADGHVITNNRPYMYSEFDPNRSISVKNGKLDVGAIWATQPYLLDKTYISETELISDFRDLFDKGKIFVNASRLVTTFEPDRN